MGEARGWSGIIASCQSKREKETLPLALPRGVAAGEELLWLARGGRRPHGLLRAGTAWALTRGTCFLAQSTTVNGKVSAQPSALRNTVGWDILGKIFSCSKEIWQLGNKLIILLPYAWFYLKGSMYPIPSDQHGDISRVRLEINLASAVKISD